MNTNLQRNEEMKVLRDHTAKHYEVRDATEKEWVEATNNKLWRAEVTMTRLVKAAKLMRVSKR